MSTILNGSKAPIEGVNTPPSSFPLGNQSKLRTILIVGITAALLIGAAFLEVKYGLISTGAKVLLTNPLILSLLGGIAACLIIYQVYRYVMHSSQKSTHHNEGGSSIGNTPRLPVSHSTTSRSATEYDLVRPATKDEYRRALEENPSLVDYFRGHFPNHEHTEYSELAAQLILERRLTDLDRVLNSAQGDNAQASAGGALLTFLERRPLALRFLFGLHRE